MYVMNVVLLTVVVVSLINTGASQSPCVTPNGENAKCILLDNCEPFIKIWNERNYKTIAFLRKSHCGFQGDKPLVCCGTVAEATEINKGTVTPEVTTSTTPTTTTTTTTTTTATIPTQITREIPTIQTTESTPVSPLPISVSTPQLFTSALVTNTPPSTQTVTKATATNMFPRDRSGSSTSSRFMDHPNFNMLPPPGDCGVQTTGLKITNGNVTDLDEYPWLAMLMYKFDNKIVPNCGGSLINKRYVLTAAHCIKGNLFSVRLGEYNLDTPIDCVIQEGDEVCADPHQEIRIEDYIIYTGYARKNINRYHDIALIRLKEEANITDFVSPICLPLNNERSISGDQLTVAGWGITEKNVSSSIKLAVDIPMWSDHSCSEIYSIGYEINVTSRQFCAGGKGGKDSCGGDSGGPLMRTFINATEYYVEGIVSFGPDPCGRQATPGVYIRVAEYVKWILDAMTPF